MQILIVLCKYMNATFFAFLIFAFIIVVVSAFIVFASLSKPGSFLDRITSKIPNISTFIIAFGLIITFLVFAVNLESQQRDATYKIVDRAWTNVLKEIADYYNQCPHFVDSLFYPWQKKNIPNIKPKNYNNSSDTWAAVLYISNLIFQSWEDFLSDLSSWGNFKVAIGYNEQDERSWLAIFLGWSQSRQLRNIFETQRMNYRYETIDFGDLLFEYSNKYHPKNAKEIDKVTNIIFHDPRYTNIKDRMSK